MHWSRARRHRDRDRDRRRHCRRPPFLFFVFFRFGNLELASLALGEAIRVAQQSGDKACVAQAMGWLHQVLAAQGHPRAGDVLRRWDETSGINETETHDHRLKLTRVRCYHKPGAYDSSAHTFSLTKRVTVL